MAKKDGLNIPPDLAGMRSAPLPNIARAVSGAPDWSYWANLAVVNYNDACILSRGFDPRVIRGNVLPRDLDAELKRRESIAKSHLGSTLQAHVTDTDRYYGVSQATGVRLTEFRAWGESLPAPFTFPDEFPKAAKPEPAASIASQPAQEKPLNTRERNNILRIIRALDAMNPKPLPQTGYAESIRAKLDELGLSTVSDDTIRKVIEDARKLDS